MLGIVLISFVSFNKNIWTTKWWINTFANNGSATSTSTLRQVSGNSTQHERKYNQPQKCSACSYTKTVETWQKENHSFSNNGSASSTTTYRQVSGNASQHERKYNQPQKCSCGVTRTVDTWNKENHELICYLPPSRAAFGPPGFFSFPETFLEDHAKKRLLICLYIWEAVPVVFWRPREPSFSPDGCSVRVYWRRRWRKMSWEECSSSRIISCV